MVSYYLHCRFGSRSAHARGTSGLAQNLLHRCRRSVMTSGCVGRVSHGRHYWFTRTGANLQHTASGHKTLQTFPLNSPTPRNCIDWERVADRSEDYTFGTHVFHTSSMLYTVVHYSRQNFIPAQIVCSCAGGGRTCNIFLIGLFFVNQSSFLPGEWLTLLKLYVPKST